MAPPEEALWTLHRVGDAVVEPAFVLHPHLNPVTLGRGDNVHKQCLAHHVSRNHIELRLADGDNYWTLFDVSSTGTFVNGVNVDRMNPIRLNDGDIIELGSPVVQNLDPLKLFRYRVQAPTASTSSEAAHNNRVANGVAPSHLRSEHSEALSTNGSLDSRHNGQEPCSGALSTRRASSEKLTLNGESRLRPSCSWSRVSRSQTKLIEAMPLDVKGRSRTASESRAGRARQRDPARSGALMPRGKSTKRGSTDVDLDKLTSEEAEEEGVASGPGPKLRRMATSMPNLSTFQAPAKNGAASSSGGARVEELRLFAQQLPPNRNLSPQPNSVFGKMPSPENPFWKVLSRSPDGLERPRSQREITNGCLQHVPPSFINYEVYCNIFYPLMLHEMWANVYRDYHTYTRNEQPSSVRIINTFNDGHVTRMSIVTLSSQENLVPEGWLVLLESLQSNPAGGIASRACFGFVEKSSVRARTAKDDVVVSRLVDDARPAPPGGTTHVWEASVAVAKVSDVKLAMDTPVRMRRVAILVSSTRLFRAVEVANALPLFAGLLFPKELCDSAAEMFSKSIEDGLLPKGKMNAEQAQAVRAVSRMCTTSLRKPRVALVHGPPGTGKTAVIVAIVLQIFVRWRRLYPEYDLPRILVTAPSNAAVDEIAKRLGQDAKGYIVMRTGRRSEVRPDVHGIFVDDLIERELAGRQNGDGLQNLRMEIAERESKVRRLSADWKQLIVGQHHDKELAEARTNNAKRKLAEEEKLLQRARDSLAHMQMEFAAKAKENESASARTRSDITRALYRQADVVATTLSSTMSSQMRQHFLPDTGPAYACGRPFNICIVDEASQCAEPETLVPLALGFTKLVLVGDHRQLPATVLSPVAKAMSYGESLFKRLVDSFETFATLASTRTPVLTLATQYRMHPEIALWPNRQFYDGALENGPQDRSSLLHPYLLLDLTSSSEIRSNSSGEVCNESEAEFVCRVVEAIRERKTGLGLGVITFYAKQAKVIRSLISARLGSEEAKTIRVSTVDGFQGSEDDVIVVSCVRTESVGFTEEAERLNVALTRARYALFVVGNFQVFQSNGMWSNLIHDASRRGKKMTVENRSHLDILFK